MSGIQMALLGSVAFNTGVDTQTVTTGAVGSVEFLDRARGYALGEFGSIVDGTSNIYGGAQITALSWNENGGGGEQFYYLRIVGASNSGWTTLTINTKVLYRADGTFGSNGNWSWPTLDTTGSQAFGTAGTVVPCVFS